MPSVAFTFLRLVLLAVLLCGGSLRSAHGAATDRAKYYLRATDSNPHPQWRILEAAYQAALTPADDHAPGVGGACWVPANSVGVLLAYICLPYVAATAAAPVVGSPGQVRRLRASVFPNAP
ncbi:hypothetical protein LRS06_14170 [Hymenobacter sp. J193]|uniref:hypothetical protein n=1 Tax=Hymenobacter sp. J193 TaxID=2898429 RepID=UPI00215132A5|nr:hypothetical protein [Hymenobacter sp. J193]MCR5888891.1 hypothetical protein [Hymenobacter sp. J193]